jgi:hypothetical protein
MLGLHPVPDKPQEEGSMIRSKLPNVGTTIFTTMSQLAVQTGALNLSQGFPDFNGPRPCSMPLAGMWPPGTTSIRR